MRELTVDTPLDGVVLTEVSTGDPVDLGRLAGVTVVTLIRHRFRLPCQEHLVQVQSELDGAVPLVVVGFSPADALAPLGEYLGLTGLVLSDPDRVLYHRLGLRRAPIWQVYSPGTIARYALLKLRGATLHKPVEDTRQMGGDTLVVDGRVERLWRPATPDDRAAPTRIAAAARERGRTGPA